MRRFSCKWAACLWILWAFAAAPGLAEDSEVARQTLKGLPGVYVIVEELQPNLLKYEKSVRDFDLNQSRIQKEIEAKLAAAGIRLLSREEWQKTPGRPVLYVNVNTHESEKYWFAYDIKLELRQVVILEANPAVKTLADTWSINITGITNIGNLKLIGQDLGVLTGRFIQSYRSVNK
jgi:hypothetical protein